MDGSNNHPSSGHFLTNPGHALADFIRSVVSPHSQQSQDTTTAPAALSHSHSAQADAAPQPSSLEIPLRRETTAINESTADASSSTASSSRLAPDGVIASSSRSDTATPRVRDSEDYDIEMAPPYEGVQTNGTTASSSQTPQPPPYMPLPPPRISRRARVEDGDEEEGDYWRDSNRQRMNSPTPHDDERHHFMPIPVDHGVPPPAPDTRSDAVPQSDLDAPPTPPGQSTGARADQNPLVDGVPHDAPHPQHHERGGQLPTLNFVFNIPIHGFGLEPQPDGVNAHGGGEAPGQHGFVFPPLAFPFDPFVMDLMEERDDPERAKRLVDGLEEVPVGLIKRMERVGGPGSNRGEAPTCAVCWESLLSPQGGGFEGNAELAKAEAAEAAREDAASQQQREASAGLDSTPLATHSETSSSSGTSSPTTASTSSDEENHPKIVVLPCSHVFHASCLLPWFSKPGRTTCPSCRFDIDPDSLTYNPRRLRARHPAPQAAPQTAAGQRPPVFGPIPLSALSRPPSGVPPTSAQAAPNPPNIPPVAVPDAQPIQDNAPEGQPGEPRLPLPPFITFDVSMIIPVFPGRPAGAAQPAAGAPAANAAPGDNPHNGAPRPPRTDNNGFRLEDSVLADAVRRTLERVLRHPAPGPQAQQPQPPAEGAAPAENAPREPPLDWYSFAGPLPGFPPMPPPTAYAEDAAPPPRPAPKRKWTLPPAPGPTLRQLVERNEREMGLRCSDVSCGVGPSDDDPVSTFDATALRQISIRPLKDDGTGREAVCGHKFHPSCLVSAERVAGWGGEDKKEEQENEGEDVEVSCPVCRAVGTISRVDWDEGACALA
ncbi:hypothetical protein C8Q78DRAFT_1052122 [Trametes maxima]|nr:hypothetical protein C8Q78DRAFT_1052122 [Trametes maxima]